MVKLAARTSKRLSNPLSKKKIALVQAEEKLKHTLKLIYILTTTQIHSVLVVSAEPRRVLNDER